MYVKYQKVPHLSNDAKIKYVLLNPKKPVMALGVYDTKYEVYFLEYTTKQGNGGPPGVHKGSHRLTADGPASTHISEQQSSKELDPDQDVASLYCRRGLKRRKAHRQAVYRSVRKDILIQGRPGVGGGVHSVDTQGEYGRNRGHALVGRREPAVYRVEQADNLLRVRREQEAHPEDQVRNR